MKKTGRVVAKKDETFGICIDDVWFNAKNVWKYAENIKKGDNVEISYEEKKGNPLNYIKKIDTTSIFKSGNDVSEKRHEFRSAEQIMRCVSVESATRYLANEKEKDINKIIETAKILYSWIEKGG